jgi:4-hydroxy-tetrahydrodipicolinate reductase
MADPIRVVVSGAAGRMGATVCEAVEAAEGMELAGRADPELDSPLDAALADADVMVDFTTPEASPENVRKAIEAGVHTVVGSTGFDLEQLRSSVEGADGEARCFVAPNFAIGAVLMMQFAEQASRHLPAAEIVELHADTKKDAPSGTSLATAARMAGDVPIHSVRLPGLVAHQEVILGGAGETLTIRHDTSSRAAFAPGVVLAVKRIRELPPGLTSGLESLL